jgi:cytidine deaminase
MPLTPNEREALLLAAELASRQAWVPYSDFPVGAAVLTQEGRTLTGCNIENASYGLTLCAERVALAKALSDGARTFRAVAVWAARTPHGAVTPCGACRQWLAEFLDAESSEILMRRPEDGSILSLRVMDLLPAAFQLESKHSAQ